MKNSHFYRTLRYIKFLDICNLFIVVLFVLFVTSLTTLKMILSFCLQVGSEAAEKTLYVAMTSDRGLCGGVHSSICKTIRNELLQKSEGELANVGIICVGDKARAQLSR